MESYKGKKMAVLGFGLEGEDVCRFLLKKGARITVFDQKREEDLGKAYQELKKKGIEFRLGPGYLDGGLSSYDALFRSPGFYRFLPEIVRAEEKGVVVSSSTKLFFDLCPAKVIGVTGTKGKGTTSTLIWKILKKSKKRAFLAGNIGSPMLSLLGKVRVGDWVVLELSSFQLIDLHRSPDIAVVLNISVDHLDWHKDKKEYLEAKMNIVRHQKDGDLAVLNADFETTSDFAQITHASPFFFSRKKKVIGSFALKGNLYLNLQKEVLIGPVSRLLLRGEHNLENVTAAMAASALAGCSPKEIAETVFGFAGLEHRLELVRKLSGVGYYNDSFSTTPETCIAAIGSFQEPIVLIAGGSEKGSDFTQLGQEIVKSKVKTLILIGLMADRIKEAVRKAGGFRGEIIKGPKTMPEIVQLASSKANEGDVVLLSPACASFDLFKSYKDRGEQFKRAVEGLIR